MRGGFTLLEVTIALAVLAFGLLTVSAAQLHAMRGGRTGRHTTQAVSIAQTTMEQLQRRRWTAIGPTAWTQPVDYDVVVDAPIQEVEQSYQVSWRIADVVPNDTRAIDVRVSWDEPNRLNRSFTISSVRFNREGL